MTGARRKIVVVAAFTMLMIPLLGMGCGKVKLFIDSPAQGIFTNDSSILVTGHFTKADPLTTTVDVNGLAATVLPDRTWSVTIPLDAVAIVNPVLAELTTAGGGVLRKRITVIVGDSIADGDVSPMGVALRLNDSGLDEIEPVITSLVNLDLATLLPAGTLVINDFCYLDSFLGCIGRVDVTVSGSPPPSIGSFSIDVDSQAGSVDGDVLLNNLFIRANVDDATGVSLHCEIDITAATTDILGNYGLSPLMPGVTGEIDVTQNGLVSVVFGSFNDSTDCSGLLGGLVELLIGLFIGDVQSLVEPAIEDFLNLPDGNGNTPIAGAIEVALAGIEISGPIGTAIGVNLETPLFDVVEDTVGITLDSDARITASTPDPLAPDLIASYDVSETFPSFGATTPVGGLPYGLAICIGTSAFNQLLKAEIESGLLITTISELDLGTGPVTLTAGVLATVIPEFGAPTDPNLPVFIDLQPFVSPFLTGDAGPGGELAELKIPNLQAILRDGDGNVFLGFVADATAGLDIAFGGGELSFALGTLDTGSLNIDITDNTIGTNEFFLSFLLPPLVEAAVPLLADSLGSFPLPAFLGLELQGVEVSKNGEYMSIFTDLVATP